MAVRKALGRGPKPDKLMRDALLLSLHREAAKGVKTKRLQMVADALVNAAIKGELVALREVFDRVDGKISHIVSSEDGAAGAELRIRWLTKADLAPKS